MCIAKKNSQAGKVDNLFLLGVPRFSFLLSLIFYVFISHLAVAQTSSSLSSSNKRQTSLPAEVQNYIDTIYAKAKPFKALSIALDGNVWVVGFEANKASQAEASAASLARCQKQNEIYQVANPCVVYLEGDTVITEPGGSSSSSSSSSSGGGSSSGGEGTSSSGGTSSSSGGSTSSTGGSSSTSSSSSSSSSSGGSTSGGSSSGGSDSSSSSSSGGSSSGGTSSSSSSSGGSSSGGNSSGGSTSSSSSSSSSGGTSSSSSGGTSSGGSSSDATKGEDLRINELFDYAEQKFPDLFNPKAQPSQEIDGYIARHYPGTDNYVGTKGEDVFVYGERFGGLLHVGKINDFLAQAFNDLFPYNPAQIEGYGQRPIAELSGYIQNQYWLVSTRLNEKDLFALAANYSSIKAIAWHKIHGLLLEVDLANPKYLDELKSLELEKGVISIDRRIFVGENIPRIMAHPNDNNALFDDLGDNWQLEAMNMTAAWDIERGNNNIQVGLMDGGVYLEHLDLIGRFDKVFDSQGRGCNQEQSTANRVHGNAVSGAIAAHTDNKQGISGINWGTTLIYKPFYDYLQSFENLRVASSKLKLVNNSWAAISTSQRDCQQQQINSLQNVAGHVKGGLKYTRDKRRIALNTPHLLHIWAAGNDGLNAATQNGAIHLDSEAELSELDNVLVVGAMAKDGRLSAASNYGQSVDIVAPNAYKSTAAHSPELGSQYLESVFDDYGNEASTAFSGTSAAAPLVSGVASLIFSLYPDFSAQQVKHILLKSVSEQKVTAQHQKSSAADSKASIDFSHIAMPNLVKIDANKALLLAKSIYERGVSHSQQQIQALDNGEPNLRVHFKAYNDQYEIKSIDWILYAVDHLGEKQALENSVADGANLDLYAPANKKLSLLVNVLLKQKDSSHQFTVYEYQIDLEPLYSLSLFAKDSISEQMLEKVSLNIEGFSQEHVSNQGEFKLSLTPGTHKFYLSHSAYAENTLQITMPKEGFEQITLNGLQQRDVFLFKQEAQLANVFGHVLDHNLLAFAGVSIELYAGSTNAPNENNKPIATTTSDLKGVYSFRNVPISKNGEKISAFYIKAKRENSSTIRNDMSLLPGVQHRYNLTIPK